MATIIPSVPVVPTRAPRLRRIGRIALALLLVPVALALLGLSYEAIMTATDTGRYLPPGRLVDVGGYRLHLHCVGAGSPTVVFESGMKGTSLDWSLVQPQLATMARVCAYDRAGTGWSDPGPLPRTPERVVADLHALLQGAGEPGPYVLVAHSMGGRYVRLFAEHYPSDMAGMVLVDTRAEYHDQHAPTELKTMLAAANQPSAADEPLRRLGVVRLFGALLSKSMDPDLALLSDKILTIMAVQDLRPVSVAAMQSEFNEMGRSDAILQTAMLGDMPLRVLVSEQASALDPTWMQGQEDQAARSTNSTVRVLPGGHNLHLGNADAVVGAVREVLQLVTR